MAATVSARAYQCQEPRTQLMPPLWVQQPNPDPNPEP